MENGEALNLLMPHDDLRFKAKTSPSVTSVLSIPIFDKERESVVAVLQLENEEGPSVGFSKDEEVLAESVAAMLPPLLNHLMEANREVKERTRLESQTKLWNSIGQAIPELLIVYDEKLDVVGWREHH